MVVLPSFCAVKNFSDTSRAVPASSPNAFIAEVRPPTAIETSVPPARAKSVASRKTLMASPAFIPADTISNNPLFRLSKDSPLVARKSIMPFLRSKIPSSSVCALKLDLSSKVTTLENSFSNLRNSSTAEAAPAARAMNATPAAAAAIASFDTPFSAVSGRPLIALSKAFVSPLIFTISSGYFLAIKQHPPRAYAPLLFVLRASCPYCRTFFLLQCR